MYCGFIYFYSFPFCPLLLPFFLDVLFENVFSLSLQSCHKCTYILVHFIATLSLSKLISSFSLYQSSASWMAVKAIFAWNLLKWGPEPPDNEVSLKISLHLNVSQLHDLNTNLSLFGNTYRLHELYTCFSAILKHLQLLWWTCWGVVFITWYGVVVLIWL